MYVRVKQIHEPAGPEDGTRILVDRLWPRGITREEAKIVLWLRNIAPTTELLRWFDHKPERWSEFRRSYYAELSSSPSVEQLRKTAFKKTVTLLYASGDPQFNHAAALAAYIGGKRPNFASICAASHGAPGILF
ncbi:MAG: DUF488 family protein [Pseudomonadota bacterium]